MSQENSDPTSHPPDADTEQAIAPHKEPKNSCGVCKRLLVPTARVLSCEVCSGLFHLSCAKVVEGENPVYDFNCPVCNTSTKARVHEFSVAEASVSDPVSAPIASASSESPVPGSLLGKRPREVASSQPVETAPDGPAAKRRRRDQEATLQPAQASKFRFTGLNPKHSASFLGLTSGGFLFPTMPTAEQLEKARTASRAATALSSVQYCSRAGGRDPNAVAPTRTVRRMAPPHPKPRVPGANSSCSLCKTSDVNKGRLIRCRGCQKWYHISCTGQGGSGNDKFVCLDCTSRRQQASLK